MMLHTGFLLEMTITPHCPSLLFLFLLREFLGVKDSSIKIHCVFFLECLSPFCCTTEANLQLTPTTIGVRPHVS